jgi:arsenite-transporting ATPase
MKSYFFTGKGGTGKTTLAASFAAGTAAAGADTLLVSLDPAHSLGDFFGEEIGEESAPAPSLTVREPDFDRIREEHLREQLGTLRNMNQNLGAFSLENLLDTLEYSPGQEEYAAIRYLRSTLREDSGRFEFIVFDTPPTGMILRIFSLPLRSGIWIERLISLREKIVDRRELIADIRKREDAGKYYRDDPVLGKMRELRSDYQELIEFFREKARIVLVLNNDPLALAESVRLKEKLSGIGISVSDVICNKYDTSAGTGLLEASGFDPDSTIRVPVAAGRTPGISRGINIVKELTGHE